MLLPLDWRGVLRTGRRELGAVLLLPLPWTPSPSQPPFSLLCRCLVSSDEPPVHPSQTSSLSFSTFKLTAHFYLLPKDRESILFLTYKIFGTPLSSFLEHALKACLSECSTELREKEKVWRKVLKINSLHLGGSCRYTPLFFPLYYCFFSPYYSKSNVAVAEYN